MNHKITTFMVLFILLLFSVAASAQPMLVNGAAGTTVPVYSLPAAASNPIGTVPAGSTVNVEGISNDRLWYRIPMNGQAGWISSSAVSSANISDYYTLQVPVESGLTKLGTGTVDYYGIQADMLPQITVRRLPGLSADNAIQSIQARYPGGTFSSVTLSGRESKSYAIRKDDTVFCWFVIPTTSGDSILLSLIYQETNGTNTGAALMSIVSSIVLRDSVPVQAPVETAVRCPNCGQWFNSVPEYQAHICPAVNQNNANNPIQCPDCGQWFKNSNDYRYHDCPNRQSYVQCPDCGQWFEAGNVFRNHVCPAKNNDDADESGKLIQCPDCGQWYQDGDDYLYHNCPAKAQLVQCPDCGQWFESGNVFRNHNCPAKNNDDADESGKLIQCPDCGQWYQDGDDYLYHNCPAKAQLVQCPDCGQWFESGNVFRNHVCSAKNNDDADESGKLIQCPDCGQWYQDGDDYLYHNCPAKAQLVQCPDCGQWFESGNVFRNHVCPAKSDNYEYDNVSGGDYSGDYVDYDGSDDFDDDDYIGD